MPFPNASKDCSRISENVKKEAIKTDLLFMQPNLKIQIFQLHLSNLKN